MMDFTINELEDLWNLVKIECWKYNYYSDEWIKHDYTEYLNKEEKRLKNIDNDDLYKLYNKSKELLFKISKLITKKRQEINKNE